MSYQSTVYQVLVASPSDVAAERAAIQDVIHAWNALHSAEMHVTLLPVLWETHSVPEMGDRPQAIINRQIVQSCDVLVGAFWTRIGKGVGTQGFAPEVFELRSWGPQGTLIPLSKDGEGCPGLNLGFTAVNLVSPES